MGKVGCGIIESGKCSGGLLDSACDEVIMHAGKPVLTRLTLRLEIVGLFKSKEPHVFALASKTLKQGVSSLACPALSSFSSGARYVEMTRIVFYPLGMDEARQCRESCR